MNYILKKLSEPSTYAGVAGLLAVLGFQVDDSIVQGVSAVLASVAGLAAIFLDEKGAA